MKKIFTLTSALLLHTALFALPVGNPWDASLYCNGVFWEDTCEDFCDPCASWCDAWSIRLGFYADYIGDRKMEVDFDQHHDIRRIDFRTYAGLIVLNWWDRIDLYAALGTSHFDLRTNLNAFTAGNLNTLELDLESETHFSYTLGVRATIWECGCLGIGTDLKYFHTSPKINFVVAQGDAPIYFPNFKTNYDEWQIGLGAAYRVCIADTIAVIPYLAVKYAHSRLNFGDFRTFDTDVLLDDLEFFTLENQRDFGYAFGITLLGCEKWGITAEWRFVDESDAFSVNTQFRF